MTLTPFERAYLARYLDRHPPPRDSQALYHYLFHKAEGRYTHPLVREGFAMWQAARNYQKEKEIA